MLSNFLFHFIYFMTFLQVHSFHTFNKCEILTATDVMEFLLRTHMDSYVGSHMLQPEFTGTFLLIIQIIQIITFRGTIMEIGSHMPLVAWSL